MWPLYLKGKFFTGNEGNQKGLSVLLNSIRIKVARSRHSQHFLLGIYLFSIELNMPGFGPAAELVAWRVPKGATIVVEAKGPKTIHTQLGPIKSC